ncbi:PARP-domain-containing protein [Terfezia boudieri ATCC MYA-4762]|uniref:Poly [ADP-ribose] polymerase n=1 Tax=Terfezia boudieri ATCC MYA-4762 TaxID=1051890 RepID=A0A3N4LRU1_9PEZI|nr:PARP-domain-containing protein [Terfezia boudieri ATCC MYA-4762]
MSPFANCDVAIAGTFKGRKQAHIQQLITANGGSFSASITPGTTTHLITTPTDLAKKGPKVKAALDKANNISIVSIEWLNECIKAGNKVDEKEYLLTKGDEDEAKVDIKDKDGDGDVEMADSQATNGGLRKSGRARVAASPAPSSQPTAQVAGKKRGRAAPAQETVKEEDEEEGEGKEKDKKKRGVKKDKDTEMKGADKDDGENPAKKVRGKKGVAAAAPAPVPVAAPAPPAPATAAPAKKPTARGAKSKKSLKEPSPDPADDESSEEEPAPKMKTVQMVKGTAPVDTYFPDPTGWSVYVDAQGVIYDGSLNQTDIRKNSNKFYYVQLLERKPKGGFAAWTRWGRVGEEGQMAMAAGKGSSLSVARAAFEKKFKDKTGLTWEMRFDTPRNGKYTYVLKNYAASDDEDSDEEDADAKGKGKGKEKKEEEDKPMPDSKLAASIQSLMALIFNSSFMQQQMLAMSYDAAKLPLGKLSKTTINQGFLALKAIGELMNDASLAQTQYGMAVNQVYINLTNRYYSVIPHAFGRSVPPVINSPQMLKREVELIESLGDMKIATEVLKDTSKVVLDKAGNRINPIDKQYESLNLNEATPLDKSSQEYLNLAAYLQKTHGKTHYLKLTVEDIFRIERAGETQRFTDAGYDKLANDNRYLLWHGSRVTNFAGILSQGLRIAPPEAPVNGYMFGKGIYLADMVTKSANYCCATQSNNTGLLMLCEAQLGDPMYELTHSDYLAAENSKKAGALATKGKGRTAPLEWMDAGCVSEGLKGVKMPDVKVDTGDVDERGLYLQYNEYIVYNVAQVKIRYLFRCKFNSGTSW